MPDDGEAAAVAALLEELAASSPDRGLGAAALRAAVLLRHEAGTADRDVRPVRPERGGPEDRRGAGRVRDDAADERDCRAGRRDASCCATTTPYNAASAWPPSAPAAPGTNPTVSRRR